MKRRASLAIAALLLAACGAGAPIATPTSTATAPSFAPFPIRTPPQMPQACMDALISGTLTRHLASGLGISSPGNPPTAVEWPFRYSAREEGGRVSLLDEAGRVVAREGDQITVGGGLGNQLWHACGPVSVAQPGG